MDMILFGSVQNYVKSWNANNKIEQKFKNADAWQMSIQSAKQTSSVSSSESIGEQLEGSRYSSIMARLRAGKVLPSGDMEFLRKKNPKMYAKAKKIQEEREKFASEIKKCKTKDEVMREHIRKSSVFVSDLITAESHKDIDATAVVEMRINSINDEYSRFARGEKFRKLPKKLEDLLEGEETADNGSILDKTKKKRKKEKKKKIV